MAELPIFPLPLSIFSPMLSSTIFVLHFAFASVVGYRARGAGKSEVALALSLVALIFAIGWTFSSFVVNLVWPAHGVGLIIDGWSDTVVKRFLYREVTGDTASLVMLTIGEIFFYRWYFRQDTTAKGTGKTGGPPTAA